MKRNNRPLICLLSALLLLLPSCRERRNGEEAGKDIPAPTSAEAEKTTAYSETEALPTAFPDLKLTVMGDSITYGTFTDVGDSSPASRVENTFTDQLKEKLKLASASNMGRNGVCISAVSPLNKMYAISLQCAAIEEDADIILIAGGTNDHGSDVPLGSEEDTGNISFYGGLHVLCSKLKKSHPGACVIFLTPIDKDPSGENNTGASLEDYREAIRKTAGEKFGFYVLEGGDIPFIASDPDLCRDGCHPNRKGHDLIADCLAEKMLPILQEFFG